MNQSVELGPYAKIILQLMLTFIMLSVSLELKRDDWISLKSKGRIFLWGILCRSLLLPAFIFLFTFILPISPEIKLGLILVASCPGGSISNFVISMAKGDLILSILLSLGSTFLAPITTPLNFQFWSKQSLDTASLFSQIVINPIEILKIIFFSLLIPLSIGAWLGLRHPSLANRIKLKTNWIAPFILMSFLVFAVFKNYALVIANFSSAFLPVVIVNSATIFCFYFASRFFKISRFSSRAIALEVSIENTSIALLITLQFFPKQIEMTMIAVIWGLWQIFSGYIVALYWKQKDRKI